MWYGISGKPQAVHPTCSVTPPAQPWDDAQGLAGGLGTAAFGPGRGQDSWQPGRGYNFTVRAAGTRPARPLDSLALPVSGSGPG